MSCNEALKVQAYFDGELDASAILEVEKHLQSCADCSSLLADLEATRQWLRQDSSYYRAGEGLRQGILKQLPDGKAKRTPRSGFLSGAFSGMGAMALAAMLVFFLALPRPDTLSGDLMNAHLRSLMSDHLIDVASSDRHTVKPWFAGHTDVSPPAGDFAAQGYRLVGGRADYVDGHRAAVVVYRHGAHIVNVFAWAAGDTRLPGAESRNGYHIQCWQQSDLDYCAVSDTASDELDMLVRLIKAQ